MIQGPEQPHLIGYVQHIHCGVIMIQFNVFSIFEEHRESKYRREAKCVNNGEDK